METETITLAQARVIVALARAFGHGAWTTVELSALDLAWPLTGYEWYKAANAAWEAREGACAEFNMDTLPRAVHSTGTGRTSWVVDSDGTTTIRINRPGAHGAIVAHVGPKDHATGAQKATVSWDGRTEVSCRHVLPLQDALTALLGHERADRMLSGLLGAHAPVYRAWREAVRHPFGEAADAVVLQPRVKARGFLRDKRPVPQV